MKAALKLFSTSLRVPTTRHSYLIAAEQHGHGGFAHDLAHRDATPSGYSSSGGKADSGSTTSPTPFPTASRIIDELALQDLGAAACVLAFLFRDIRLHDADAQRLPFVRQRRV